jgi:ATPase subunit of ABC transporter with duplicated ATPase domains
LRSRLLDARQITRRHGGRTLLNAVDLRVEADSRIGLIGANGAGKSTLLRILAGAEVPDGGAVQRFGMVGYLPQLADTADGRRTVRETILDRVGLTDATAALDRWARRLEAGDVQAVEPHAGALEQWLALGGADVEGRLTAAVGELGLGRWLIDHPLGALSGGQAARAGLAALQVARLDVVLLDEPTNHLDADGLERLEALIEAHAGGIVIVSHDRQLLADTVSEIVELDRRTGDAKHYRGGWDAYERERTAARERLRAEREHALDRRQQLQAAERETRRRAAASRSRARARVHDNDKNSREWVTMRAEEMAGRARKMGERAARIDIPDAQWENPTLVLDLTAAERRESSIIALDGVTVRRGAWTLGPLDLAVNHGDRALISGPNGSGKTTLLAVLAGQIGPADGRRRVAPQAVIAQLGQTRSALMGASSLTEQVRKLTGLDERTARSSTSNRSRFSKQHCNGGRERSSSPLTTVDCVAIWDSTENWRSPEAVCPDGSRRTSTLGSNSQGTGQASVICAH